MRHAILQEIKEKICGMKKMDGHPCGSIATHHWGPVLLCCPHFDEFIISMFDLAEEVRRRRHSDLVTYFESQRQQASRILGPDIPPCEDENKK